MPTSIFFKFKYVLTAFKYDSEILQNKQKNER